MQFSLERVEELRREKPNTNQRGACGEPVPRDLFTNHEAREQNRSPGVGRTDRLLSTALYRLTDDPGRKKNRIAPDGIAFR